MNNNFTFCIFGFVRDSPAHSMCFDEFNKFLYVPSLKYEDKSEKTSCEELKVRYGKNNIQSCEIYEYDGSVFQTEVTKLKIPPVGMHYQQPARILSFFNHLKVVSQMCQNNSSVSDNDIVVLLRSDIYIKKISFGNITTQLERCDVCVWKKTRKGGYSDHFFCVKKKNLNIFVDLYEAYKKYIKLFNDDKLPKLKNTGPESIFRYYFDKLNLNVSCGNFIDYELNHICNKYCGCNKNKTELLR